MKVQGWGRGLLPVAESGGLVGALLATWHGPLAVCLSVSLGAPPLVVGLWAPVLSALGGAGGSRTG